MTFPLVHWWAQSHRTLECLALGTALGTASVVKMVEIQGQRDPWEILSLVVRQLVLVLAYPWVPLLGIMLAM